MGTGHFWNQDRYFRKFFRSLNLPYLYINPSADFAALEDGLSGGQNFRYHKTKGDSNFVEDSIKIISTDLSENLVHKAVIFFPWLPQFNGNEMHSFSRIESKTKISIGGVSVRKPEALWGIDGFKEQYVHQSLFIDRPFEIFWIGEAIPRQLLTVRQIRHLPEYAETNIKVGGKKLYDIAFHGMLSSYRGLFEILVIALFNPKLKVHIRGYSFSSHRIWRPIKFKFTRYTGWKDNFIFSLFFSIFSFPIGLLRFLPNIKFSKNPFSDEAELDENLGLSRTVFYCPKLPHGSGLMTKSLSAGLPVLWNGLPGQAHDFLATTYSQGNFSYWEIFIPGRITKKVSNLKPPEPQQSRMLSAVLAEISEIRNYL